MSDLVIDAKLSYICDVNGDKSVAEILKALCGEKEISKDEFYKRIEICYANGGKL